MTRGEDADGAPERLGEEGDVCLQCGTPLQVDQRYCLTCGTPRAEPRLDYERHLGGGQGPAGAGPGGAGPMGNRANGVQWSPVLVVLAIAALGVMLLLGVLIGKDDGDLTVTEVPASTTTTTPTTSATTTTTPTTTPTTTTPTTTTTPLPDESGTSPDAQRDGAGGLSAPGGTD